MLRLIAHLPEEDLARLARHLDPVKVQAFEDLAALATAHPQLGETVQRIRDRTAALATRERRVALSETVLDGFRRLTANPRFGHQELITLFESLPAEHAELFMRVFVEMPASAFGRGVGSRSVTFFQGLARSPESMRFLIEAGYDTFAALYRSAGHEFARFGEHLSATWWASCRPPSGRSATGGCWTGWPAATRPHWTSCAGRSTPAGPRPARRCCARSATPVRSINYIFSDRAAATANRSLIRTQGGGEVWVIDRPHDPSSAEGFGLAQRRLSSAAATKSNAPSRKRSREDEQRHEPGSCSGSRARCLEQIENP